MPQTSNYGAKCPHLITAHISTLLVALRERALINGSAISPICHLHRMYSTQLFHHIYTENTLPKNKTEIPFRMIFYVTHLDHSLGTSATSLC